MSLYAIDSYDRRNSRSRLVIIDTRWQKNNKTSKVELWKYDPGLFAKDGEVDPVSLAMSLSDNTDERV